MCCLTSIETRHRHAGVVGWEIVRFDLDGCSERKESVPDGDGVGRARKNGPGRKSPKLIRKHGSNRRWAALDAQIVPGEIGTYESEPKPELLAITRPRICCKDAHGNAGETKSATSVAVKHTC